MSWLAFFTVKFYAMETMVTINCFASVEFFSFKITYLVIVPQWPSIKKFLCHVSIYICLHIFDVLNSRYNEYLILFKKRVKFDKVVDKLLKDQKQIMPL